MIIPAQISDCLFTICLRPIWLITEPGADQGTGLCQIIITGNRPSRAELGWGGLLNFNWIFYLLILELNLGPCNRHQHHKTGFGNKYAQILFTFVTQLSTVFWLIQCYIEFDWIFEHLSIIDFSIKSYWRSSTWDNGQNICYSAGIIWPETH